MKSVAYAVSALALVSSAALAQEGELQDISPNVAPTDEIVITGELSRYGATKSATPILETSRSISIETENQFRDKGALTLDDTLNYTSGVVGDTFGFATRGDFPRVRGFDAAEYRDGQQVLFGFYNNTRSDVYMLEQVEILKGPASVLYGKGTPGGIVNAISKLAGPDVGNEFVATFGNHNRYEAAADLNFQAAENVFLRVVGLYRNSDTQVDFVNDDAIIVMPSITFETANSSVTAMVEVVDRNSDTAQQFLPLTGTGCASDDVTITPAAVCTFATGEEVESSTYLGEPGFNKYDTNSLLVSLLGYHEFNDAFSVEGVARYKDGEADYNQSYIDFLGALPRVGPGGDGGRTFYKSESSSEQLAVDVRARWSFATGPLEHEVFGGFAYQNVETDNDFLFLASQGTINIYNPVYGNVPAIFSDGTPLVDGAEQVASDIGIYMNDQISAGPLKINVGFRYDDTKTKTTDAANITTTQTDDAFSFSAGILYAFDFGLSPYMSFAESFEPVIGTDGITSQPLKPREGRQWEGGLKYQPPGINTYITLAYFDIEESNLANPSSLVTQPDSQQEGIGKVKGVEVEALTNLGDWSLEGNFTYLDTESADGARFDSVPEVQASGWVQYQPSFAPFNGLRIGAGLRYLGDNVSNFFVGGTPVVTVETDGVVLADMLVGYAYEDWDITLNMRNLTNEEFYATCLARGDCFTGEERTIVGRVARRF